MARVVLPPRSSLRAADSAHVRVVGTDEIGVQSVLRYRLAPSGTGR